MGKIKIFISILFLLFLNLTVSLGADFGSISGYVKDVKTGKPLPSANVVLVGTSMGAASDMDGKYSITEVPPGIYTLRSTYIGYKTKEVRIQVVVGKKIRRDFKLEYEGVVKGKRVVVTAQAEGQMEAINQQLAARSIVNVVSSDRIQELPDATAAESVARLPGVSVIREGGEGSKIVIRGMSAEHNKVQIEGIEMASTDSENRSVDISMISPYMLEGIEVQKAVTADHDADAMGGIVNFTIKEATPGLNFNLVTQGMHNGLRNSLGDYKLVGSVDNRFFNNRLGVFFQVDTDRRTRDSETLRAEYQLPHPVLDQVNTTYVNRVLLEDVYRKKRRMGGTLVLDYKMPTTHIKFVNFLSQVNTNTNTYSEECYVGEGYQGFQTGFGDGKLFLLTNSFHFDQSLFLNANLHLRISRSRSVNDAPDQGYVNFRDPSGLEAGANIQTEPQALFQYARNDTAAVSMRRIQVSNDYNKETIWSYKADFDYDYALSKQITGKLKIGGKYQQKNRSFDHNMSHSDVWLESTKGVRNFIIDYFDLPIKHNIREVSIIPFIGSDYHNTNYLNGDFKMGPFANIDMVREIARMVTDSLFPASVYEGQEIVPDAVGSRISDYSGNEYFSAAYIMTDLKIGDKIEFDPGLRYERNVRNYTGIRGDATVGGLVTREWKTWHDTTMKKINSFLLPMIHLKIRPQRWLDIHLAYTESISRPDYRTIVPSFLIARWGINYGNPDLKPSHSKNIDLQLSFHSNKIGLLTIGAFHKTIFDQIFSTGGRVIPDSSSAYQYPGLEEYNWDDVIGNKIYTYVNNNHKGIVRGLEFGWQTHFWYLPGFLKGLVFNGNYTHMFSETKYPRTTIKFDYSTFKLVNNDTSYTSRLIDQPRDIVNLAFGYDYKGFSGRVSMLYQSDVFTGNNFWPELRASTAGYLRWDVSIRQRLPIKNMDLMVNLVNLNAEIDKSINHGTNNPTSRENYGRNIIVGVRYKL